MGFMLFAIKWLLPNTVDIICASMSTSDLCNPKLRFSFLNYVTNQTCLFFMYFNQNYKVKTQVL